VNASGLENQPNLLNALARMSHQHCETNLKTGNRPDKFVL